MADIPGLIDGASEGVGLGHDFLRHIERTKILIHVVDVSGIEGRDPIEDYEKINAELAKYSEKLARKRQVVAANKIDLLGDSDNLERLMDYMTAHGVEVYPICAMTGEGMDKLLERVWTMLEEYVEEPDETTEEVVYKAQRGKFLELFGNHVPDASQLLVPEHICFFALEYHVPAAESSPFRHEDYRVFAWVRETVFTK